MHSPGLMLFVRLWQPHMVSSSLALVKEPFFFFFHIPCISFLTTGIPGLYNAFLAPGSPCELNIEHALRNSLASRMTKAVGDDESMLRSLQEVVELFEMAQTSVFKLMSSVSWHCSEQPPFFFRLLINLVMYRTRCPSFCEILNMPSSFRNITWIFWVLHDHILLPPRALSALRVVPSRRVNWDRAKLSFLNTCY